MARLDVGVKAVIVGARTPNGMRNIGKIVTCELFVRKYDIAFFQGIPFHAERADAWIVSGDDLPSYYPGNNGQKYAIYSHYNLVPLDRDDFEEDDEKVYDIDRGVTV